MPEHLSNAQPGWAVIQRDKDLAHSSFVSWPTKEQARRSFRDMQTAYPNLQFKIVRVKGNPSGSKGKFRHEDIAAVPSGWKVRTVTTSSGHRVRVAFPPGRRHVGAGRLISILHPNRGPEPCVGGCTLRSRNPQELMVMGANAPRSRMADPALKHQIAIAKQTLRMSDAMARVMGGMSKEEARRILHQYGIRFKENPARRSNKLDAFTKKHLATWLDRVYLYGADKRSARKIILAMLKREPGLLEEGKSWPEILRMGEAAGIVSRGGQRAVDLVSNPSKLEEVKSQAQEKANEHGKTVYIYNFSTGMRPLYGFRFGRLERPESEGARFVTAIEPRGNPGGHAIYKGYQIHDRGHFLRVYTPDGSPLQPRIKDHDYGAAYALIDSVSEHRPLTTEEHARVYGGGAGHNPQELLIMGANPGINPAIPARRVDQTPKYRFAVLSVHKGSDTAEVESSFGEESEAERAFEVNYSKWGLPDTNFYLVDWEKQTVLRAHETFHARSAAEHVHNPRVEVVHGENPPVEEIAEEFTGSEAEWIDVYNEPHMSAGRYAQLGKLIALYVKPVGGGQVLRIGAPENRTVDFAEWWHGFPPLVVTDSTAKQIYFVNGNQELSRELLERFGAEQQPGTWKWILGQVRRIDYQCRKEHVSHPEEDLWRHDHGGEDKELPTLVYDQGWKRLEYEGGNYRIEGAWIWN